MAAKKAYAITEPNRLMLRPLLILQSASKPHKRRQEVAISAPPAERLSAWRGRSHPSAWDSRSGIVLRRQWLQVEGLDWPQGGQDHPPICSRSSKLATCGADRDPAP
jgi:hypothetical protein